MDNKTLLITLTEAGKWLGLAEKTARNWDCAGKFPIPTFSLGSKRMVRTQDLESFVAGLGAGSLRLTEKNRATDTNAVRPRGRPRKQQLLGKGGLENE